MNWVKNCFDVSKKKFFYILEIQFLRWKILMSFRLLENTTKFYQILQNKLSSLYSLWSALQPFLASVSIGFVNVEGILLGPRVVLIIIKRTIAIPSHLSHSWAIIAFNPLRGVAKVKLFYCLLSIIYWKIKIKSEQKMFVNIIEKRGDECETYTEAIKKFFGGNSSSSFSVSCPLGIAYNNIQITYRNTSLKSSTLKMRNVCDLLTDGTIRETKEEFFKTFFDLKKKTNKWHNSYQG